METTTYIAMNRFKIVRGKEDIFEKIWKERDSKLSEVKGFINFNLIDLTDFNSIDEESEDVIYEVEIESNISNEFSKINKKYLKDLGSLGLLNRINNLNKIFENK